MEQSPCAGIVSREWKRTPFPIQSSIRCPFCYIGGLQPIPEFDPVGIQWGDIGNRCIYIGIYDQKGFKLFVINTLFKKINLHHHFASCHHPGNSVRRNHFTKYLVFLHLYTILLQGSACFLKEVKWHQWEIQRDVPHLEETRFLLFLHIFASSYQLPSGRKYYGIKREIQKKEHPQWKWETHFFLPQLREEVMIWRHKSGSILLQLQIDTTALLSFKAPMTCCKSSWGLSLLYLKHVRKWKLFDFDRVSFIQIVIIPLNPLLLTQKDKFFL